MRILVMGRLKLAERPRRSVLHVRARDIDRSRAATLLVVDGVALPELEPDLARRWLQGNRRRLLLCADAWATEAIRPWMDFGPRAFVTPGNLDAVVDRIEYEEEAGLLRFVLLPEEWLPGPMPDRPTAAEAIRALPSVHPVHDIGAWAASVGLSSGGLWSALKSSVGLSPTRLGRCYVRAMVRTCEAQGVTRVDAALMLGYSDASALNHALARCEADEPEPPLARLA